MTQAIDIIKDALGHLRVIDANAAPDENDTADALRALNNMVRAWESDGVTLGWSDVAAATETLNSPAEADEALGYNLALRLRARYGVQVDPDVVALARDGLASLRASVASSLYEHVTYPDLPSGEGQGTMYGWRAGFYR